MSNLTNDSLKRRHFVSNCKRASSVICTVQQHKWRYTSVWRWREVKCWVLAERDRQTYSASEPHHHQQAVPTCKRPQTPPATPVVPLDSAAVMVPSSGSDPSSSTSRSALLLPNSNNVLERGRRIMRVQRLEDVFGVVRTNLRTWLNHLNTQRRPLYLKTQSVPRCKHFSSRL
jgi:hypothetical protein